MIFDNDQNKNVALQCKESVRYLGVIIDNNLSWKQHIDHVAVKISRTVGLICKLRHFLPRHTLLTIHRSLVTPYLTYGLTAWGQAYKSYLEKLLKLRFIYSSERNQHAIPLFIDAGVLPLKFLYYELLTNLMFEIRHRNAPGNIQDFFQDISDIHSYNTRSSVSNNFYTQSSRLSIQVNSFSRIGTKIWNEMPMSLRKLPKIVFKRKIKQLLFEILASEDCYIDLPVIIQKVKLKLCPS